MKKFESQIKLYREKINCELKKYFDQRTKEAKKISAFSNKMIKSLENFSLRGGQRIRPMLLIFGYKAITGIINERIIKASIAIELIESSLLIHDDIIDRDDLRRGGFTIHKEYSDYLKKEDIHFGESMAILIGNIANNYSYRLLVESSFATDDKIEAIKIFSSILDKVNFGQALDSLPIGKNINEKDVDQIHLNKTATYTGQLPILLGTILAGASEKQKNILNSFARKLGQAFQVQDDIVGTFGEPQKTGKPVDSDIKEGKKTLLIVKALEKSDVKTKKFIMQCLGNEKTSVKDIQKLRKIIYKTGSLQYSMERAKMLIDETIAIIKPTKIDFEAKEFLINLAKYILIKDKIIIPE